MNIESLISESKHVSICDNCSFKDQICRYISSNEFLELKIHTKVNFVRKGHIIIAQGDPMTHVLYLSTGLVKLEHVSANKQIQIPALIKGPALLSGNYQISGDKNVLSVVAVEESEVCLINIAVMRNRMNTNAQFAMTIFEMLSAFHQRVLDKQLALACKRVPGRIAGILLLFREKFYKSDTFSFPLTRREIAHLTLCREENVIRNLSSLEEDGIIEVHGKAVKILDVPRLQKVYDLG